MRALLIILVAVGFGTTHGCSASGRFNVPENDVEWGIGSKADEGDCDRAADLCWNSSDTDTATRIRSLEQDIVLELGDARTALEMIVDAAWTLSHKLTPDELRGLADAEAQIQALAAGLSADLAAETLRVLEAQSLGRVLATSYAAYAVPIGQSAQRVLDGAADSAADGAPASAPVSDESGYTEGMRESMQLLRDTGVIGKLYVTMLRLSGVLDRPYETLNASNFGSYDARRGRIIPVGLSREERTDRIIASYRRAAGLIGLLAGGEAMIPIAGIGISVAHETYKMFELSTRMTFEIASVYGWDIREGRNLFHVLTMVMTVGALGTAGKTIATNAVLPLLARTVAARLGTTLPATLAKDLATASIMPIIRLFTQKGEATVTKAMLTGTAKGVGRQILGYVTLGLAVLITAAADYMTMDWLGEHVRTVAQQRVVDLMLEGATYLSQPLARDCLFQSLNAVIWADGVISEQEKRLFMGFLGKPYRIDERLWYSMFPSERQRYSRELRESENAPDGAPGASTCLAENFQASLPQHRMSLLAHLYAMVLVDQRETPEEHALYDRLRRQLDGTGWFDGAEIPRDFLTYVERSVLVALSPTEAEFGAEYREMVAGIVPSDTVAYLATPDPVVVSDFECGFSGGC